MMYLQLQCRAQIQGEDTTQRRGRSKMPRQAAGDKQLFLFVIHWDVFGGWMSETLCVETLLLLRYLCAFCCSK